MVSATLLPTPGDRQQAGGGLSERAHQPVDLTVEAGFHRVEFVDVVEVHPQQQGVMVVESPHEGFAQRPDLGSHPGQGHLGEHIGIAFPGDQRLQHPPARHPQHVGDDGVQLDAGILEQFLDSLGLPHPLPNDLAAIAGEVAQLGDLGRRDERPRSRPHSSSWASHSESFTSVLRPGRFLKWAGFTNNNSSLAASRTCHTGRQ